MLKHLILVEGRPYITRDGLLHIAHRSGQFDGIEATEPVLENGFWRATASVYRKDMTRPFRYYGRYPEKGKNKDYGPEMATKVAESMALRRAFDISAPTIDEQWDRDMPEAPVDRRRPPCASGWSRSGRRWHPARARSRTCGTRRPIVEDDSEPEALLGDPMTSRREPRHARRSCAAPRTAAWTPANASCCPATAGRTRTRGGVWPNRDRRREPYRPRTIEKCACGGLLWADYADPKDVERHVRHHQRTLRHASGPRSRTSVAMMRAQSDGIDATAAGAGAVTPGPAGGPSLREDLGLTLVPTPADPHGVMQLALWTPTSLTLPDDLAFEGWQEIGDVLGRMERSVQWWMGDGGDSANTATANERTSDRRHWNFQTWLMLAGSPTRSKRFPDIAEVSRGGTTPKSH